MPKCLVCGNSSASTTRRDITYHTFPKNEHQRRKWLNVYGIGHCNDSHRICSDHFLKENYRPGLKRYLKRDSIPHGYDKNCFPSNCTRSNDVVMSNNEFLPTELNCLSYTTLSNDDETSTNAFLPREENHLRKVQSYENITRLQTEPFERRIPTCIANDNIQTVTESVIAPVLTTTKYKQEATSSECILIDDDNTEDVEVKDHGFINEISTVIVLPSELWRIVFDFVQNTTSFYKRDSSNKTMKKISFYNSLLPEIQIYGTNYKCNKPIKSKNELQRLLIKVDTI